MSLIFESACRFLTPLSLLGALTISTAIAEPQRKFLVSSPLAPKAIGPYSQAVRFGDTLYLSGQTAIDPTTNKFLSGSTIEEQTARVLENIKAVLAANGMTLTDVVSVQVMLKDLNEFERMNTVYASFFGGVLPARATFEVARLPGDAKIEIVATARK